MSAGIPKWLTPAEAAAHCRIGKTNLYGLIKRGALRPRKLGKRTLISREDIDALIEGTAAPSKVSTP